MTAPPEQDLAEDQAHRRWRPLRRIVVIAFAVSTTAVLAAGFVEIEPGWVFNLVSLMGMVSPLTTLMLFVMIRFVPWQPDDKLDERLRGVRDRAHRYAYTLLSVVVVSLLLASLILSSWFDWLPNAEAIRSWVLGISMLSLGAPSSVMAWTEP